MITKMRLIWRIALIICILSIYTISTSSEKSLVSGKTDNFVSEVAICAVAKNEREIHEWVEYHYKLGIEKFYIYDNGDIDEKQYLKDFIQQGVVSLAVDTSLAPQLKIYHQCLKEHRHHHRWIAFIDVDEFIVTKNSCSIPSILKRYERYGGLTLSWMMFGSSGHEKKPPGGVLGNYWKCFKFEHIKSIVNTRYTLTHKGNPHSFTYRPGYYAVDTNFIQVPGPTNPFRDSLYEIMYINHYHLKSREEFEVIKKRGRASTTAKGKKSMNPQYFEFINGLAKNNCSLLFMPKEKSTNCALEHFENRPLTFD